MAKITRKDIRTSIKRYFMAILIAIPILFIVDYLLLTQTKIPNIWVIVIDCFVIALVYVLWMIIVQKYRDHITKKRTEFLHKKKLEEKVEQEKMKKEKEQKREEVEQQPAKIVQKQKRNYQNKPSKKHKKKK